MPMSAALEQIPQTATDEDVARQVLEGRVELFEVLMRRNNPRLYRALRAIVREEAVIEELMQESYLRAYASLAEFGGRSRFSTWLVRIGINLAMTRARRSRLVSLSND